MRSIFTQKQLLRSKRHNIKKMAREFPICSVVRTPHFHYQDPCSVSSRRTKVPQAMQCRQKKKKSPIFCTILFIYSITKNIFKFSSQEHKQWLLFILICVLNYVKEWTVHLSLLGWSSSTVVKSVCNYLKTS